jgi:hypothetical protein
VLKNCRDVRSLREGSIRPEVDEVGNVVIPTILLLNYPTTEMMLQVAERTPAGVVLALYLRDVPMPQGALATTS